MVPFNRPLIVAKSSEYMRQAMANMHLSGDGPFTKKCQALLEAQLTVAKALLTTSCTDALEMSALLLELQPGDEVIVPAFTFVSTVNAFVLRGARPVFADIRPDTLNLDERQLEKLITARTRAVVPVHYAGVGCELDVIGRIATRYRLTVVEDNAHGLLGKYRGRYLGTFGALATQSFHETKNFSCGEGGALLINDPQYVARAEILREKGTNRSRFYRGQIDKYSWVDLGSSFLPSDLLAAFLLAQLEVRQWIQARRRQIWDTYAEGLRDWADDAGVRLPTVPSHCEQSYHLFYVVMPSLHQRQALIAHLAQRGVASVFHYQPLHLSEMGRRFGGCVGDCPVTEAASDRLVRLPFHAELTDGDQKKVIAAVRCFNHDRQAADPHDPFRPSETGRRAA